MDSLQNMQALFDSITPEMRAEMDKRAREYAEAERAKAYRERLEAAKIPEMYRLALLGRCNKSVQDWAASLMGGSERWLLLKGKNGRGKTYAACAILLEAVKQYTVEFATLQDVLDEYHAAMGSSTSVMSVEKHFVNVDVLLLDDVGKEQATDWSLPKIFQLIDKRQRRLKPTIITTNMTGQMMIDHFAARGDVTMATSLVSRLGGRALVDIIELEGEDRRMHPALLNDDLSVRAELGGGSSAASAGKGACVANV